MSTWVCDDCGGVIEERHNTAVNHDDFWCGICGEFKGYSVTVPGGFVTKDGGEREAFATGAQRDTQKGKPRYDLIPPGPLYRLAMLYSRGAEKYTDDNWMKGFPLKRLYGSLMRHLEAWRRGVRDGEDHLAGVLWNCVAIMWTEDAVAKGLLPKELDDMKRRAA